MKQSAQDKKQLALAKDWNKNYPVGVDVIVTKDDKTTIETVTRSPAFMLGASGESPGHTAVIQVKGIAGAYSLERVKVKHDGKYEIEPEDK